MKSIIQKNKECYKCKTINNLELHHCLFGRNRKKADEDGLTVWLCNIHHRGDYGPHGKIGKDFDLHLKKICEKRWCEYYDKTPEDFLERYKINYL